MADSTRKFGIYPIAC